MHLIEYDHYEFYEQLKEKRLSLISCVYEQLGINVALNEKYDFSYLQRLDEINLLQKIKSDFVRVSDIIKNKGKQALSDTQEAIIKFGGNVANVIMLIINKLKEWMISSYNSAKTFFENIVEKNKSVIEKGIQKLDQRKVVDETKKLKGISYYLAKWLFGNFFEKIKRGGDSVAQQELALEVQLTEMFIQAIKNGDFHLKMLLESDNKIPYVSVIVNKLHKVPPFSILHKVQHEAEDFAENALNKFSIYATKLADAPGPYTFEQLAALFGIFTEIQFKGIAMSSLVSTIPGIGIITSVIGNIALALAFVATVEIILEKNHIEL